jgi:uncharacterized protein YacL
MTPAAARAAAPCRSAGFGRGFTRMILHLLRALFVLLVAAVGFVFVYNDPDRVDNIDVFIWILPGTAFAVLLVCIDILAPRRKLAIFSGAILGLIVGALVAYALSYVVTLIITQNLEGDQKRLIQYTNTTIAITCCYLCISFILQSRDDFRFIIPYVEFSKQTKGARPILLDTSVLIDGRVTDIVMSGIIESQLIVPQFVLVELQQVADSGDNLKRARGRRGLDVLAKLRGNRRVEVSLYDPHRDEDAATIGVDHSLVNLAKELNARVMTNDFNLNKVAQLVGVDVINLNDLANAMKPAVMPGERMSVRLIKPGNDPGQGVGFLEDGTMVVVEAGRNHINEEVEFTVTNTRQTSAGKMIFGRMGDDSNGGGRAGASSAACHACSARVDTRGAGRILTHAPFRRHPAGRGQLVALRRAQAGAEPRRRAGDRAGGAAVRPALRHAPDPDRRP